MLELLSADDEARQLSEPHAVGLLRVLRAVAVKASGEPLIDVEKGKGKAKKETKAAKDAAKEFKQEFTLQMMKSLPPLLRKFQADPVRTLQRLNFQRPLVPLSFLNPSPVRLTLQFA
jgi:hypothetical protein